MIDRFLEWFYDAILRRSRHGYVILGWRRDDVWRRPVYGIPIQYSLDPPIMEHQIQDIVFDDEEHKIEEIEF